MDESDEVQLTDAYTGKPTTFADAVQTIIERAKPMVAEYIAAGEPYGRDGFQRWWFEKEQAEREAK